MKLSKSFWQTYKETPADAEIPSHQLMLRAGLMNKSAAGIYNYLPFGYKTIRKVEQIVREEMDLAGCQEILMSVVTPGELWQESGRWSAMGGEMLTFKDKGQRDLCISPTNEEVVTDIFRKAIKSYKQLPISLYQINTKFRDEIRPRFGLMRGREFIMKDAYSFHIDKDSLDVVYDDLYKAYENIFKRIGLEFTAVEADAGAMGNSDSKTHEFQAIANTGEDAIIYCSENGYAANVEKAVTKRSGLDFNRTETSLSKIETPNTTTIEALCEYLKVKPEHTLKSLVYSSIKNDKEETVLILVLGDDELNEVKLKNLLGADHVVAAKDSDLEALGVVKGYIGAIDLKKKVKVFVDSAVNLEAYYFTGANEVGYHYKSFKLNRDFSNFSVHDLRMAKAGDLTECGKYKVQEKRGIEVGHIFQLGDKYTKAMNVTVLDSNGKAVTPLMGCYGIGVTRIVAAAIEQHHDENGIVWPKSISPYDVYFAFIGKSEEYAKIAEDIYEQMRNEGFDVLFDDRNAGAGFKFKDSDLLGLPVRVVLGERDFKESGELEIVIRKTNEKIKIKKESLITELKKAFESAL